jgi:cell division protein FtsN
MIPALLLLAGGAGYFLFLGDGRNALSSFDPFVALKSNTETQAPVTTEEEVDDSFLYSDTTYASNQETASTDSGFDNWSTAEEATADTPLASEATTSADLSTTASVPAESKESNTTAKKDIIAEKPVMKPAVEKAPEAANGVAQPGTPPRFYVIIGGFSVEANAYKLKNQLAVKGNNEAKVILPKSGGNLLKVSYADYDTFNTAAEKAQELKAEYGSSVWVFKY